MVREITDSYLIGAIAKMEWKALILMKIAILHPTKTFGWSSEKEQTAQFKPKLKQYIQALKSYLT